MSPLRRLAEKIGLYDRFRFSWAYEQVLKLRNPGYLAHLAADADFYREMLGTALPRPPGLIFDVGANFGNKARSFRKLGARVICFEPDARCVAALRVRFRRDPGVIIEHLALGEEEGTLDLYVHGAGSAANTLSAKHRDAFHHDGANEGRRPVAINVSTLKVMIACYGVPDFLKIDVEGFENSVLRGLPQPVPVLSFEANLPMFTDETVANIALLKALDSDVRFNLQDVYASSLLLPEAVNATRLREIVMASEPRTYDVFAFSPRALLP